MSWLVAGNDRWRGHGVLGNWPASAGLHVLPPSGAIAKPPAEMPAALDLVAGARFEPDSDTIALVTARWCYAGVKQGTREMVRVGPVA